MISQGELELIEGCLKTGTRLDLLPFSLRTQTDYRMLFHSGLWSRDDRPDIKHTGIGEISNSVWPILAMPSPSMLSKISPTCREFFK